MINPPGVNEHDRTQYQRFRSLARRVAVIAVIFFGFLMVTPWNSYRATQVIADNHNLLDGSWELEVPARLGQGDLSGRDFTFTYGPLFQITQGLGFIIPPRELGSMIRFMNVPAALLITLLIWLVLGMTKAPLRWRAPLFLLWVFFWPIASLKPLAGVCAVAVCGYVLGTTGEKSFANWSKLALPWAISAPLFFLYSFDMGVLTLAPLLLIGPALLLLALSVKRDFKQTIVRRIILVMVILIGSMLFLVLFLKVIGLSRLLPDSLELAFGFSVTLASGFGRRNLAKVGLSLCLSSCALLFIAWIIRQSWRRGVPAGAPALMLFAALVFSLTYVREGLTRADWGHVFLGTLPAVFVLGWMLPCYALAHGKRYGLLGLVCTFGALLLSPLGFPPSVAQSVRNRLTAISSIEFTGSRLKLTHPLLLRVADVSKQQTSDSLFIWPNETMINVVTGKKNPHYTLQSYAATTDKLQLGTVKSMESIPDLPVVTLTNRFGLDGVEDLTRSPIIFRYLLDNYELDIADQSFLFLKRRADGPRQWREQPIPIPVLSFVPLHDALTVNLDSEADCRASDLLVLSLRATKTRFYGVGKSGRFYLTFLLSSGEQRVQNILLAPDGELHQVLISAATVRDPLFLSLFGSQRVWHSSERVTQIQVNWHRHDRLSFRPARVTLERMVILRRDSSEQIETSLKEQNSPEAWKWCYQNGSLPAHAGTAN